MCTHIHPHPLNSSRRRARVEQFAQYINTHTHTHTHTNTHTNTHTYTYTHAHTHSRTCIHTLHTHKHTPTHALNSSRRRAVKQFTCHIHIYPRTHVYTSHMYLYIYIYKCIPAQSQQKKDQRQAICSEVVRRKFRDIVPHQELSSRGPVCIIGCQKRCITGCSSR